jgi:surfeit locus 1 family protein
MMDEFDYRRVLVVTPLEHSGGSTVLVDRGWINKSKKDHKDRIQGALPVGEMTVEGLLRAPWKENMPTPYNRLDLNEFYFPDVEQMANLVGAQPVWIEQTKGSTNLSSEYPLFFLVLM